MITANSTQNKMYGYLTAKKRYDKSNEVKIDKNEKHRIYPFCNEKYIRYTGEIEYKFNNLSFCTWTCKSKYRKEYERKQLENEIYNFKHNNTD